MIPPFLKMKSWTLFKTPRKDELPLHEISFHSSSREKKQNETDKYGWAAWACSVGLLIGVCWCSSSPMLGKRCRWPEKNEKRIFMSKNAAALPIYMSEVGRKSVAGKEKHQKKDICLHCWMM